MFSGYEKIYSGSGTKGQKNLDPQGWRMESREALRQLAREMGEVRAACWEASSCRLWLWEAWHPASRRAVFPASSFLFCFLLFLAFLGELFLFLRFFYATSQLNCSRSSQIACVRPLAKLFIFVLKVRFSICN
jgi:hypothetical protein